MLCTAINYGIEKALIKETGDIYLYASGGYCTTEMVRDYVSMKGLTEVMMDEMLKDYKLTLRFIEENTSNANSRIMVLKK